MNYHIGTMLIDENFDDKFDCPLCRIKFTVENRLSEQYLGEGVMEDNTRNEVNKLGFCERHFKILYKMPSKLGLALQSSTIFKKTVDKTVSLPKNFKQAKTQANEIDKFQSTCVICKYLDEHMVRYYKTVAEVFFADEKFREKIKSSKGYCLEHYAKLLTYSNYAKSLQNEYLTALYLAEKARIETTENHLDEFCNHHDYRNSLKPLGESKECLIETLKTVYGSHE